MGIIFERNGSGILSVVFCHLLASQNSQTGKLAPDSLLFWFVCFVFGGLCWCRWNTKSGKGVTAYVIDTGIRFTHQEFEGRATCPVSFIEGEGCEDGVGHGTHVAGMDEPKIDDGGGLYMYVLKLTILFCTAQELLDREHMVWQSP